jgi:hypothetical protein
MVQKEEEKEGKIIWHSAGNCKSPILFWVYLKGSRMALGIPKKKHKCV